MEAQGRIAGDSTNDEGFNEVVYDEATGTYSLKNLQLAENSDFSFDLKLVGTQYLEQGVYIFNSEVRNGQSSQTFVALAEGDKEVNVKQSFVISFDVEENNAVVEQHIWHSDSTPDAPPAEPEEPEEEENPPRTSVWIPRPRKRFPRNPFLWQLPL